MKDKASVALNESIKKWQQKLKIAKSLLGKRNPIVPDEYRFGPDACPLCELYMNRFLCKGCPVSQKPSRTMCRDTPYYDAYLKAYNFSDETIVAIQKEIDFLKSLRKKKKKSTPPLLPG